MMKTLLSLIFTLIVIQGHAQTKTPADFGFRHLKTIYKGDTVNILIKSKQGDEMKRKPVFLFCQGSLPQPLIKLHGDRAYSVFPFRPDSIIERYHLVIIGKPFVPVIADADSLAENFVYIDPLTGRIPRGYSDRNLPDYYVQRNLKVIDFLAKLPYIDNSKLVVAGHSEGSTIAARLAAASHKVSHLIYSGGCPLGRIMAMISERRAQETDTDSTSFGEEEFDYWKSVVADKENMDDTQGDTNRATYDFSAPPMAYLQKLKIPVLIVYGTKDWGAPYNDYFRMEMIKENKRNFTFAAYIGLEHNFFPLTPEGQPDYNQFNWDRVAADWVKWLDKN